jgi:hypothetical protein
MTATTPPPLPAAAGRQPAVGPQPSVPVLAGGVGGAVLVVGTRVGLWLGVQLGLAGLLVLAGAAAAGQALDEAAGWWMIDGALVDLGTLWVIFWLPQARGGQLSGAAGAGDQRLAGRPRGHRGGGGQRPRGGVQRRADQRRLRPGRHPTHAGRGRAAPLGERGRGGGGAAAGRGGRAGGLPGGGPAPAGTPPGAVLAGRPGGGVGGRARRVPAGGQGRRPGLGFAAYRVGSVLPFLAAWTGAYYALGRRLLPVMAARWVFNAGTALALALGLVA